MCSWEGMEAGSGGAMECEAEDQVEGHNNKDEF